MSTKYSSIPQDSPQETLQTPQTPQSPQEISIQEYAKQLKLEKTLKLEKKAEQCIIIEPKIKKMFDTQMQSIESTPEKWKVPIDNLRKDLSKNNNSGPIFTLGYYHTSNLRDQSLDQIEENDIADILKKSRWELSKRIKIPNHPLNGCRVYLEYNYREIKIQVDISEESYFCVLV